jgi:ribosomal protein L40E
VFGEINALRRGVCLRCNVRDEGFNYNNNIWGEVFGEINALRRGVCLRCNVRDEGFNYNNNIWGFY